MIKVRCEQCGRFFGIIRDDGSMPYASGDDRKARCSGCNDVISMLPRTAEERDWLVEQSKHMTGVCPVSAGG